MQSNGLTSGNEDWVLGCFVTIKTILEEKEISGTIFTFDRLTNLLVISERGSQIGSVSYRFIKADCIREITNVEPPVEMMDNALEFLRLEDCVRREQDAVREIELRHAPAVEVVEAGQKLLLKLSEQYECKMQGQTINIEDKVFVDAPYTIANFRSSEEHSELREILKLTV